MRDYRRAAVLAVPAVLPLSMAAIFGGLSHRLSPRAAYNVGFGVYWLAWCFGFPALILGPRRAVRLLTQGRRPSGVEMLLLLVPVAGAVGTEVLPNRKKIDARVAAVMVAAGLLNATGEELLWRGVFLEEFPHDRAGCSGRLLGSAFGIWHHRSSCRPGSAVGGSCLAQLSSAQHQRSAPGEAEASETAWPRTSRPTRVE
jgi:membrane protease YdiL (CAAX protease family)